ncbi:MAG: glycosyltransferase [Telluria sp.]
MHLVDITMFYAPEGGGVSTYLNAKSRWLARRPRMRHTILTPNLPTQGNVVHLPNLHVPGLHGYLWPWTVGRCARILRQQKPDLIEAGDASSAAWAALRAARRLQVPAIAFYHSDTPRLLRRRFGKLVEKGAERYMHALYKEFDLVLAPSKLIVQRLASIGIAHAVHQPLGIDSAVFSPAKRDPLLRAELGLAPDTRLLAFAGRFTPEKKLDLLVAAVKKLGHPYHLVMAGCGRTRPPPADNVTVVGFLHRQEALARLLASCDALVHAGDGETFGLIALEAMACGLPVIHSGGGIAELVDGSTGLQVRPGRIEDLCGAIEAVFAGDRETLSRNAVRRAGWYDWNTIMPQLAARYDSVCATHERDALAGGRQGYAAD